MTSMQSDAANEFIRLTGLIIGLFLFFYFSMTTVLQLGV